MARGFAREGLARVQAEIERERDEDRLYPVPGTLARPQAEPGEVP